MLNERQCREAFENRDRAADGLFFVGVVTTGIYCRPSCPARRPKPENVRFYADAGAARAAGLRACLRCRPDSTDAAQAGIARAIAYITSAEETPKLNELAAVAGLSPYYFHRRFKDTTGVTPAAYVRQLRSGRAKRALERSRNVTDAIFDAGYNAASRFYAEADARLGMTPSAWRQGGRGVTIRHAVVGTSLGPMLVAATEKGICRLAFDEGEAELRAFFPNAALEKGGAEFDALVTQAIAAVETPARMPHLPVDVRGTAFQEAVWQALRAIPVGETRSYAELAAAVGRPGAVRAAGSACGANPVAVLVPCHRVLRTGGGLGGYAYGLQRKQALLDRETEASGARHRPGRMDSGRDRS